MLAGLFDFCVFAPLFSVPFGCPKIRAPKKIAFFSVKSITRNLGGALLGFPTSSRIGAGSQHYWMSGQIGFILLAQT